MIEAVIERKLSCLIMHALKKVSKLAKRKEESCSYVSPCDPLFGVSELKTLTYLTAFATAGSFDIGGAYSTFVLS